MMSAVTRNQRIISLLTVNEFVCLLYGYLTATAVSTLPGQEVQSHRGSDSVDRCLRVEWGGYEAGEPLERKCEKK